VSRELRYERLIRAAPEHVFDTFTSPEGQREFYGTDRPGWIVESRCDLRVGGEWTVAFGPSRDALYHHRHVFEAIDRPRRIAITSTETRLDGSRLVTRLEFTFEARDGATLMAMHHAGFPTDTLRDEHRIGVPRAFDRLAPLAEV
jgi:uncharacterized protein YndB with AHSA1/START domain